MPPKKPALFLLGQTFSELAVEDSTDLLAILCGKHVSRPKGKETVTEQWEVYARSVLSKDAAELDAPSVSPSSVPPGAASPPT